MRGKITTRFESHPVTGGGGYRATGKDVTGAKRTIRVQTDYALSSDENHRAAATALADKLGHRLGYDVKTSDDGCRKVWQSGVWATWHGGANYTTSDPSEATWFPTTEDVAHMCWSRYDRGVGFPCVDETSGAWVYHYDPRKVMDPYPDEVVGYDPVTEGFGVGVTDGVHHP